MTIRARHLMQRDLTAVSETDLIQDALHVLYSQRITGVPVVREDWVLVGFLSESDILKAVVPSYLEVLAQSTFLDDTEGNLIERLHRVGHSTVSEFMTPQALFVEPDSSLMTVADLMLRKKIKRLPVIDHGRLVGVIDRGAFCDFMMEGNLFNDFAKD